MEAGTGVGAGPGVESFSAPWEESFSSVVLVIMVRIFNAIYQATGSHRGSAK